MFDIIQRPKNSVQGVWQDVCIMRRGTIFHKVRLPKIAAESHSGAYANMAQTSQFHEKTLSLLIRGWKCQLKRGSPVSAFFRGSSQEDPSRKRACSVLSLSRLNKNRSRPKIMG